MEKKNILHYYGWVVYGKKHILHYYGWVVYGTQSKKNCILDCIEPLFLIACFKTLILKNVFHR